METKQPHELELLELALDPEVSLLELELCPFPEKNGGLDQRKDVDCFTNMQYII